MTRDQATAAFGAVAIGAICAIVYAFPPAQYRFYPVCPIYRLTGWLCPGCGLTRGLHALLHGDIFAAVTFNPLLVLITPLLAALAMWQLVSLVRTGKFVAITIGDRPMVAMLAMMLMFSLARNLI